MKTPKKYIRTDVVEAFQYTGDADIQELLEFTAPSKFTKASATITLQVLGGEIQVQPGDYLIRIVNTTTGIYNWYTADQNWFEQNHRPILEQDCKSAIDDVSV